MPRVIARLLAGGGPLPEAMPAQDFAVIQKFKRISHFSLNSETWSFFMAMLFSIVLISCIFSVKMFICGLMFKHLHAYKYCLTIMNNKLYRFWYWKLSIPSIFSDSVNWMWIPVSVSIFDKSFFHTNSLTSHLINKWIMLSGSWWQNIHLSFWSTFHLYKFVFVITALFSTLYWKSLNFVETVHF